MPHNLLHSRHCRSAFTTHSILLTTKYFSGSAEVITVLSGLSGSVYLASFVPMTVTKLSKVLMLPVVIVACFQLFLVKSDAATSRIHEKQEYDNEALDNVQTKELGILPPDHEVSRSSFPSDFLFGSTTSAAQTEGGAFEGGKGPSCWDFDCTIPGKIVDGSNASVACDGYHKYEEDVDLMDVVGFNAYRFSIAWTRIFPEGVGEQPNEAGVDYYNRVIDTVLSKGIEPWVSIYHLDMPQALVDKHDGWHGREIVPAFAAYAEACFAAFGDRVKHWMTINEPTVDTAVNCGFRGTVEETLRTNTPERRYIKGHNMLLAHAAAVKIYREKYQGSDGKIGVSLEIQWYEPHTNSPEDVEAAETAMAFRAGWILDPLFFGQYPEVMKKTVGFPLPSFTDEERKLMKGSVDFLGINYYTGLYVSAKPVDGYASNASILVRDYSNFPVILPSTIYVGATRAGVPIGPQIAGGRIVYPLGLEKLLLMLRRQYGNPVTYVTENGFPELRNQGYSRSLEDYLNDSIKIQYFRDHLDAVHAAHKKGADVRGYFVWALLDSFEFIPGYTFLYGLHYVDFEDGQRRYMKASGLWFQQFLRAKTDKTEW